MKKAISYLVAICIFAIGTPLSAATQAPSECDYEANYEDCTERPLGYEIDKATSSTISMSMMGWGIGLAIAIALIAGILHQSPSVGTGTDDGGT